MHRSVLLRHDLPDGSWHYDWLIDPVGEGGPDDRTLITFRLTRRPDENADPFDGTRLPDHRRFYLDFEGPLSANRGSVTRIAEWPCTILNSTPDEMHLQLETPHGPLALRGAPASNTPSTWNFMCH